MNRAGSDSSITNRRNHAWTLGDLLVALLISGFGVYFLLNPSAGKDPATTVLVSRDGTRLSAFPLNVDKRIDLNPLGVNMVVEIKDGRVRVASSDCKQQLCVHHGWIQHPGEAIFCLPNHTTVELSGDGTRYDAISR